MMSLCTFNILIFNVSIAALRERRHFVVVEEGKEWGQLCPSANSVALSPSFFPPNGWIVHIEICQLLRFIILLSYS